MNEYYSVKPEVVKAFQWDGTLGQLFREIPSEDWRKFETDIGFDQYIPTSINELYGKGYDDRQLDAVAIIGSECRYSLLKGIYVIKNNMEYISKTPAAFHDDYVKISEDTKQIMMTKKERDYMVAILDGFLKGEISDNNSKIKNEEINFGLNLSKKLENTKND